jgi:hypothetical protein
MLARARRSVRDAIEAHLGSRQVARVIYGSIIGLALVVALQDHPPGPGVVAGTLLATAAAVGLAELFSEIVGNATRNRQRIAQGRVRAGAVDAAAVAFGVAFPAAFFLLAATGAMSTATAFTIAKWSGAGLITGYGYCGARLAGEDVPAALLQALAVGAIGVLLIAFKALVH